jgi:putative nucleotidyltransferase with HDIG domain
VPAAPFHVLIVDDEPQVCSLLREGLSRAGLRCRATCEPAQAKELLTTSRVPVLVTDIAMPALSGFELLAHAERTNPDCKVILITGVSKREYLAAALHLGAYDYFQKPFSITELAETVCRAATGGRGPASLSIRAARAIQCQMQAGQTSLDSINALVHAVEAKDPFTRRHSEHVTHYAVSLARFIRLPEQEVESIRIAALLHDIGKIGVPDDVLTKPGPLSDSEFAQVKIHPEIGARIIASISLLAREARLVRYHHERWDGSGYPEGLAGEDIPLGARVIHVADAIDAMLMERTYRGAYSLEQMLAELKRCSGTQFDPALAAAAAEWCRASADQLVSAPAGS